jgi:aerobic-type carbon monoxide dehydrogenase small subunit (CoxS/CutS family)
VGRVEIFYYEFVGGNIFKKSEKNKRICTTEKFGAGRPLQRFDKVQVAFRIIETLLCGFCSEFRRGPIIP